jgi:hypothetical protein
MKILLYECLPLDFRHSFRHHEAHSADAGFKGAKNGKLLRRAQEAGYQVLITGDQGLLRQRPSGGTLSIILVRAKTNQLEDLLPIVDVVLGTLATIGPGQTVTVP